jgi:hypothetical protein
MPKNKTLKLNKTKGRIYKKKDFYSGDGMLTTIWGPSMWHYLHTMSFNYPVEPSAENKTHYRDFILNLQHVLPCKYCRQNLRNNLKVHPLTMACMASRDTFSRYVYKLHEIVNKMLKKKSGLSYCDVRERYEHFRARCTDEKPKVFNFSEEKEKEHKNKTMKISKGFKNININKKEKGCTEPLYGKKAKCIIKIVPQEQRCKTMQIDRKCIKTRD